MDEHDYTMDVAILMYRPRISYEDREKKDTRRVATGARRKRFEGDGSRFTSPSSSSSSSSTVDVKQ